MCMTYLIFWPKDQFIHVLNLTKNCVQNELQDFNFQKMKHLLNLIFYVSNFLLKNIFIFIRVK